MDQRHREQLSTPLVTSTLILIRFIVDKAQQARRIVRWEFISPILKEARLLFVNIGNMIDGVDCKNEALQNLYSIQKQTVMVCYLEKDNRPKSSKNNKGRKKHYGFDIHACAYIDEMCDNIIKYINNFGQNHQPYDRG